MGKIGEIDWGGLWVRFALFGVMFLLLGVLLSLRYFDVVLGEVQLQQQIYRQVRLEKHSVLKAGRYAREVENVRVVLVLPDKERLPLNLELKSLPVRLAQFQEEGLEVFPADEIRIVRLQRHAYFVETLRYHDQGMVVDFVDPDVQQQMEAFQHQTRKKVSELVMMGGGLVLFFGAAAFWRYRRWYLRL